MRDGLSRCSAAAVMFVVLSGAVHAQQLTSDQATCRKYIGGKVRALANIVLYQAARCLSQRASGTIAASVVCSDPDGAGFPASGQSRIANSASAFVNAISKHCAAVPASDGYTACPSPCDTSVPAISTYMDVANCLVCLAKAQAGRLTASVYGASPALSSGSAWACQNRRVGAAVRFYFKTRAYQQQLCQYKDDRGTIAPTDCKTTDLTGRIASAATRLDSTVAKCSDTDLAALTSCATTVSAEQSCALSVAAAATNALFDAVYPVPPPTPTPTPSESPSPTATATETPVCTQSGNFLDVSSAPGAGASYPKPSLSVSCTSSQIVVASNGIPPYTYVAITPNGLAAQSYTFHLPRSPQVAAHTTTVPCLGVAGVSVNGMPFFGPNEATFPDPYGDPVANSIMDECLGHTGMGGTYHYHALLVKCLTASGLVAQPWNNPDPPTDEASPIIGYALDGFPVYGPYGCADVGCSSIVEYLSSWDNIAYQSLDCTSSASCGTNDTCALVMVNGVERNACVPKTYAWSNNQYVAKAGSQYLDQCNGHYGPNGDYHYHATSTFPYIIGCYRGTPSSDVHGGACPAP